MKRFVFFSLLSLQYWSSCDTISVWKFSNDNIDYQTEVTSIYLKGSEKNKPKKFSEVKIRSHLLPNQFFSACYHINMAAFSSLLY